MVVETIADFFGRLFPRFEMLFSDVLRALLNRVGDAPTIGRAALTGKFVGHTFGADLNEHVFRPLARVFRMPAQTNGGREYEFVIARRPW